MQAARLFWRVRDDLLDVWLNDALASLAAQHSGLIKMQPATPIKRTTKSEPNQLPKAQKELITTLANKAMSTSLISELAAQLEKYLDNLPMDLD